MCGYCRILLGTYRYLRVAMNHMLLLHSSRPTFPCSSPTQLRETNELPFFVSSLQSSSTYSSHCGEIYIHFASISPGKRWFFNINIPCTAGAVKFANTPLAPGTRECIKKYNPLGQHIPWNFLMHFLGIVFPGTLSGDSISSYRALPGDIFPVTLPWDSISKHTS